MTDVLIYILVFLLRAIMPWVLLVIIARFAVDDHHG
jgi:hypothetical protein